MPTRSLFAALALLFVTVSVSAQQSHQTIGQAYQGKSKCAAGAPCQSSKSNLPFLLPVFVSNSEWTSVATIVNGNSVDTYVDVTVRGGDGQVAAQKRINVRASNFVQIDVGTLLAEAHSTASEGSVSIAPAEDGTGIQVIVRWISPIAVPQTRAT